MRLRRLLRQGHGEDGYTLIELLTVMVILTTILTALTALFMSGAKSELEQNRRYQAQQEARAALEQLRREVHCASGITATAGTPVSSITVALPAACPPTETSVVWSVVTSASGTGFQLNRAGVKVADNLTTQNAFTYYAPSASSLGKLHVNFPVNVHPSGASTTWTLVDDIVLRNTLRA